ncbi:kinase-like protein, partial [Linnemannia elongata AG-77]
MSKEGHKSILREVRIHKGLADRHIIQFYDTDYVIDGGERRLRLIMEYAEGGSLNKAIPRLQWGDKERITGEIAHGLSYIHSLGIIHCDVKSHNVLLTKNLEVKLCDFGSARTAADKQGQKRCNLGTEGWMAPEFEEDATAYSPESDIYALGIVMWEMASGEQPFTRSQVLKEKLDDVPYEYHRIMRACWDEDPKRRPGSREISFLSHGLSFNEALEKLRQFSLGDDNLDRENLRVLSQ